MASVGHKSQFARAFCVTVVTGLEQQFSAMQVSNIRLFLILCLLLSPWMVTAQTIHLNDGTVLRGEIERFSGGKYDIKTSSLGRLSIDEYDIASIEYGDTDTRPVGKLNTRTRPQSATTKTVTKPVTPSAHDIQQIQLNIAGNTDLMQSISGLQSDPQIQAILQDLSLIHI